MAKGEGSEIHTCEALLVTRCTLGSGRAEGVGSRRAASGRRLAGSGLTAFGRPFPGWSEWPRPFPGGAGRRCALGCGAPPRGRGRGCGCGCGCSRGFGNVASVLPANGCGAVLGRATPGMSLYDSCERELVAPCGGRAGGAHGSIRVTR